MPGRQVPKKDGANTEMPRGAVRRLRSEGLRMGEPLLRDGKRPAAESIGGQEGTEGTETSQYLEEKKTTVIPEVAASEPGRVQTVYV